MKLEYTEGCICYSLTIDGTETSELPVKKLQRTIKDLITLVDDPSTLQSMLEMIASQAGRYEDMGHCEECGDTISKWTIEV